MVNPGVASMLVRVKQEDLLRRIGRPAVKNHLEVSRDGQELRTTGPVLHWVFLIMTRELVRFAGRLGCDRDELVRVIYAVEARS